MVQTGDPTGLLEMIIKVLFYSCTQSCSGFFKEDHNIIPFWGTSHEILKSVI